MLSHLCQARLWTRSERKALTGAVTNDTSRQLKTWPVLNNTIGEICHTEVINGKRTKTDYFLYSKDMSSAVTIPFHSCPWNIKENNGGTEENSPVFSVNCSYSQVSENPAYGLTPAWTQNMQDRYRGDSSSPEIRSASEEPIYGGVNGNENDIKVIEEATELHQELNHKYSLNSNKIEHIKHYLKTSSPDHFSVKSKSCDRDETAVMNCDKVTPSKQKKELRHNSGLTSKEQADQVVFEEKRSTPTVISNVHSLKDVCNDQGFSTTNLAARKAKPQLDKLHCGSTFLSEANRARTQNKVYELPLQCNNLSTEHAPEQTSLWTESHLPSNNHNHRFNTYLNNDWYQSTLPKYQKLPLQKTSPPSPIPSQKTSQNVEEILQRSSRRNPANISMVIMQSTNLQSNPKENSSEKSIALPMGSLVAALYKESDWLYVQTPHGEKGFVTFSNCMALGTLTDEFFALTNVIDNFNDAQDSESSEEESDFEQLVSMEPLRETNYSKLAEAKANCGSKHQQNNMEEILSMMTKHSLGHANFCSEKVCDNKRSKHSDCNGFQPTSQGESEERNINSENIKDICNVIMKDKLPMYKNCFNDSEKSQFLSEDVINLQDLHAGDLGMQHNVKNQQYQTSSNINLAKTDFDLAKNGDINFTKRKLDNLSVLEMYNKTDKMDINKSSNEESLQDTFDSYSLPSIDQNKATKETGITSSIFGANVSTYDKRIGDTGHHTNINDVQKCEKLPDSFDAMNVKDNANYTKTLKKGEHGKDDDDDMKSCDEKETNLLKNEMTYFSVNSKSQKDIFGKEESIIGSKNDFNKGKVKSCILAIIENYSGEEEGTLSVRKGDLVTLLDITNSEWMWVSTANGTEGYIPSVCTSQVGIF